MKKRLLIVVLQLAAMGADAWRTDVDQSLPYHRESDPVARPFVGSRAGRVGFFGAQAGLELALPWALRRRGHNKMAAATEWAWTASAAYGAASSWHGTGNTNRAGPSRAAPEKRSESPALGPSAP